MSEYGNIQGKLDKGRKPVRKLSSILNYLLTLSICMLLASTAFAENIVEIAIDGSGIPFLLDDKGHVWAFRNPMQLQEPVRLPNLNRIKNIVPYMAVDTEGQVFTWDLNESEVQRIEDYLDKAAYTPALKFGNLKGITAIEYSWGHFIAVVESREIVDWTCIPGAREMRVGCVKSSPIRKVLTRAGVKSISSASWWGELIAERKRHEIDIEPYFGVNERAFGLVALFDDGTIMGWGTTADGEFITPSGDTKITSAEWAKKEELAWKGILLAKAPGARKVLMGGRRNVILDAHGSPQFLGGSCPNAAEISEFKISSEGSSDTAESLTDVTDMARSSNTQYFPDIYIRSDGSAWAGYVRDSAGSKCINQSEKQKFWKINLPSKAVRVAMGGDTVLILDDAHRLWKGRSRRSSEYVGGVPIPYHKSFSEVKITLK